MTAEQFIRQLRQQVEAKSLLRHPFYQKWIAGELTLDQLRCYAVQYYHHEAAFPRYLSAVHTRCPHLPVRQQILANLWDEEYGPQNHPALWLQFCAALGLERQRVEEGTVLPETRALIATMTALTSQGHFVEGLGALFAYESQVPAIATKKIEGLKAFYGVADVEALAFFTVHQEADTAHSQSEAEIIARYAATPEARAAVQRAVDAALDAHWLFLDGVLRASPS